MMYPSGITDSLKSGLTFGPSPARKVPYIFKFLIRSFLECKNGIKGVEIFGEFEVQRMFKN